MPIAKKEWICCICNETIPAGDFYFYDSFKSPRYDDLNKQIGIEYIKIRHHEKEGYCESILMKQGLIDNPQEIIKQGNYYLDSNNNLQPTEEYKKQHSTIFNPPF